MYAVAMSAANGPACNLCGCRDVAVMRQAVDSIVATGQARCNHCGNVFRFHNEPEQESIPADRIADVTFRCPTCNSSSVSNYKSLPTMRYMLCLDCGKKFKQKRWS